MNLQGCQPGQEFMITGTVNVDVERVRQAEIHLMAVAVDAGGVLANVSANNLGLQAVIVPFEGTDVSYTIVTRKEFSAFTPDTTVQDLSAGGAGSFRLGNTDYGADLIHQSTQHLLQRPAPQPQQPPVPPQPIQQAPRYQQPMQQPMPQRPVPPPPAPPVYQQPVQPVYQPPVYQQPVQPMYQQPAQPVYQQPMQQPLGPPPQGYEVNRLVIPYSTQHPELQCCMGVPFRVVSSTSAGMMAVPEYSSGLQNPVYFPFDTLTVFETNIPGNCTYQFASGVALGTEVLYPGGYMAVDYGYDYGWFGSPYYYNEPLVYVDIVVDPFGVYLW